MERNHTPLLWYVMYAATVATFFDEVDPGVPLLGFYLEIQGPLAFHTATKCQILRRKFVCFLLSVDGLSLSAAVEVYYSVASMSR